MSNNVQYPIIGFSVNVPEIGQKVIVYVVASANAYGAVMPLSQLANVAKLASDKDPDELAFSAIVNSFEALVDLYLARCKEGNCSLPFPTAPNGRMLLEGDEYTIRFHLNTSPKDSIPNNSFSLNGEHLIITKENVDVADFFPESEFSSTLN